MVPGKIVCGFVSIVESVVLRQSTLRILLSETGTAVFLPVGQPMSQ